MKNTLIISHPYSGNTPGSLIMKGFQLSEYINIKSYCQCVALSRDEILKIKNTNIILLGNMSYGLKLSPEDIRQLKKQNNNIIIDPIDDLCCMSQDHLQSELERYEEIDGVVYPSNFVRDYLSSYYSKGNQSIIAPHQYDDNFNKTSIPKDRKFKIFYGGSMYSNPILDNPPKWLQLDKSGHTDSVFNTLLESPIHFNHRVSNTRDFIFKPTTKLSSAAACESPIISSKDKSYIDYLPDDYPLFVENSLESVEEKYELVKEWWGTKKWSELLDIMKEIKEKTSPLVISKLYLNYLNQF